MRIRCCRDPPTVSYMMLKHEHYGSEIMSSQDYSACVKGASQSSDFAYCNGRKSHVCMFLCSILFLLVVVTARFMVTFVFFFLLYFFCWEKQTLIFSSAASLQLCLLISMVASIFRQVCQGNMWNGLAKMQFWGILSHCAIDCWGDCWANLDECAFKSDLLARLMCWGS